MGFFRTLFGDATSNPYHSPGTEEKIAQVLAMHAAACRRAAEYPTTASLINSVVSEHRRRAETQALHEPVLEIFKGILIVIHRLYDDQGRSWVKPLPAPQGNNGMARLTYQNALETLRPYLSWHLEMTKEPQRTIQLLRDVYCESLLQFIRNLPRVFFSNAPQYDNLSLPEDISILISATPSLFAASISAFFKAFDQPEIRKRGLCRLKRYGYVLPSVDICDWPQISSELIPEHQNLFSSLPPMVRVPLSINLSTRFEHTHIVGGTGHGKTQLLQLMIYRDLLKAAEGKGSVVVIDSQGDLIRTISHLALFDPNRPGSLADKLVLIDPKDVTYPPSLNLFDLAMGDLERYDATDREKLLNGTIALYEYIFGALLGAELTNKQGVIFRYLARLMMVIPGATIHTLIELMENGEPFRPFMAELDGSARRFFETQFFTSTFDDTKRQVLHRLWGVLSNPTLDRMFGHPRNKVDLFEAMNTGKIVLINTAKDLLKSDGCQLFGRFFISLIAQAALQRAAIPEDRRRSTFVYVDEAHEYFDHTVDELLNQARKFKVGMVLAHQNLEQLPDGLRATIMASTSTKFAGGVSARDASVFAREMRCQPEFLLGMQKQAKASQFACWIKNTTPQAATVEVPLGVVNGMPTLDQGSYNSLIAANRARYCAPAGEGERVEQRPASPPQGKKVGFELGSPELL